MHPLHREGERGEVKGVDLVHYIEAEGDTEDGRRVSIRKVLFIDSVCQRQ